MQSTDISSKSAPTSQYVTEGDRDPIHTAITNIGNDCVDLTAYPITEDGEDDCVPAPVPREDFEGLVQAYDDYTEHADPRNEPLPPKYHGGRLFLALTDGKTVQGIQIDGQNDERVYLRWEDLGVVPTVPTRREATVVHGGDPHQMSWEEEIPL